jgi:type IV pilus assembly protein PilB
MDHPRVRLGELLVRAGLITGRQLEEALAEQQRVGKRLGSLLVEIGLVSETQVTQILSQQLSVPWVSLQHIDFSRELLDLVPVDAVERFCLIPIYVRRVRGLGDALYVAMDDPTNTQALQEVGERCGLHVRAMIAPPSDIRAAIHAYYGIGEPPPVAGAAVDTEMEVTTGVLSRSEVEASAAVTIASIAPKEMEPVQTMSAEPPKAVSVRGGSEDLRAIAPAKRPAVTREASVVNASEEAPRLAAAAFGGQAPAMAVSVSNGSAAGATSDEPPPSVRVSPKQGAERLRRALGDAAKSEGAKSRRMVALTLLDGTTIKLPGKGKGEGEAGEAPTPASEERLTARDLVAALRAAAHGADASEVLGSDVKWERMFAALLSLLLKKHLISDWEFVEELTKG